MLQISAQLTLAPSCASAHAVFEPVGLKDSNCCSLCALARMWLVVRLLQTYQRGAGNLGLASLRAASCALAVTWSLCRSARLGAQSDLAAARPSQLLRPGRWQVDTRCSTTDWRHAPWILCCPANPFPSQGCYKLWARTLQGCSSGAKPSKQGQKAASTVCLPRCISRTSGIGLRSLLMLPCAGCSAHTHCLLPCSKWLLVGVLTWAQCLETASRTTGHQSHTLLGRQQVCWLSCHSSDDTGR
jgi:hypothetical protein